MLAGGTSKSGVRTWSLGETMGHDCVCVWCRYEMLRELYSTPGIGDDAQVRAARAPSSVRHVMDSCRWRCFKGRLGTMEPTISILAV